MKIKIRDAERKDFSILSAIAISSKRHWKYPQAWIKLWEDEFIITPDFIKKNKVLIAETNKTALGFTAISNSEKYAQLEHLWIRPEFMNRGVGKMLFQNILKVCKKNGIFEINIASDPYAKEFYEKMGAKHIGFVDSKPAPRKLPLLQMKI